MYKSTEEDKVLFNHTYYCSDYVKYCAVVVCLMLFCMLSYKCFSKPKNVSMSAPSHCIRCHIVSRAFYTSLFFGGIMRIELAALSFWVSLLLICNR